VRKTSVLLFLVFTSLPGSGGVFAQPGGMGPVLEMNTDMVRLDAPSTRLFLGLQDDTDALFRIGLQRTAGLLGLDRGEMRIGRLGLLAVFAGVNAVANRAFSITAHDQAHMEAALAVGAPRAWLVRSSDQSQEMSIWEFLLESFNPTTEPGLYDYQMTTQTLAEQARVSGEGLNTNMAIAASIAREIDEGEGHVMDLAPYLLNKLWGIGYLTETGPTSDAGQYVSLLNQQGFPAVTREALVGLHAASCLVSGGFLGLLAGACNFIVNADAAVKPLGLRVGDATVYWPEATTWLNPDSVSVLVSTHVAWSGLVRSWAGIDLPVLGNTGGPEITIGAGCSVGIMGFSAELTARSLSFPFLKGSVEVRVGGR
jgi:hypothetical protein